MFNRCKHEWTIANKRFVPGVLEMAGKRGGKFQADDWTDGRILYGYTEISMICDNCGQPKVDMIVGKWSGNV